MLFYKTEYAVAIDNCYREIYPIVITHMGRPEARPWAEPFLNATGHCPGVRGRFAPPWTEGPTIRSQYILYYVIL